MPVLARGEGMEKMVPCPGEGEGEEEYLSWPGGREVTPVLAGGRGGRVPLPWSWATPIPPVDRHTFVKTLPFHRTYYLKEKA